MEENDFIKLTNAVYKILDFLPEQDPLKARAKEKALAILENLTLISGAKGWFSLQKEKASAQLLDDIGVLENYLKIGKYQGWIDSMNFLIITKEYNLIKSSINPPTGLIKKSLEINYRVSKEDVNLIDKKEPFVAVQDNKLKIANKPLITIEKFSERQGKILQILGETEKAQVADFIKELPNVTKRTVRRDLDDLLKRGKIVRVGQWNQVFYKVLKDGALNQENSGTQDAVQDERVALIAINHSIEDLAQFFDYKEGAFANNYNPKLADKIRSIDIPEKIINIEQLESTIKNHLTPEEQLLVNRHLTERMNELRNEAQDYRLFNRTKYLS